MIDEKISKKKYIRLYFNIYKDPPPIIELCPHISIEATQWGSNDGEYNEELVLYCNVCKKKITRTLVIN